VGPFCSGGEGRGRVVRVGCRVHVSASLAGGCTTIGSGWWPL
ncbi:MAG: hypothetical protein AVDCRST_MAG33-2580, partial [uncultured Thermomicrobiales bacterium]